MPVPWWREAVVYQIYPRSFADGNGDGIGDLPGVLRRLDHLSWLGVDAIWLSPVYRSPMADFGYDVSDHCDVDPVFGDLADVDRLIAEAHARGIRVLLDWVPNHTSDRHPWFRESRRSRDSPRREWYVWRDGPRPPNNWRSAFGGPAWTWDAATGAWYLHVFLPQQPDLNWANPEVVAAMHGVLRFWLERGVDGFRADVIHLIGRDPALPDDPLPLAAEGLVARHDYHGTHELLRGIRGVLDEYPGERVMVGEVNLRGTARLAAYHGRGDELHLAFNFLSIDAAWDAGAWARLIAAVEEDLVEPHAWPTWVLSNHDVPRHRTRYGGSEARARAAAVLLLTLRGTPFLYAGEELGTEDARVPPGRRVDPDGRDGCRAPLPWTAEPGHGWGPEPWLPFGPEPERRNAARLREDRGSILHLYRRLLAARRASPALRRGSLTLLEAPPDVLLYERAAGDDRRRVAINFGRVLRRLDHAGRWRVEVAGDGEGQGQDHDGRLGPEQALLLGPARA